MSLFGITVISLVLISLASLSLAVFNRKNNQTNVQKDIIDHIQIEIQEMRKGALLSNSSIRDLTTEVRNLESIIQELRAQLETNVDSLSAQVTSLNSTTSTLERDYSSIRTQLVANSSSLGLRTTNLEVNLNSIKMQLNPDSNSFDLTSLNSRTTNLERKFTKLNSSYNATSALAVSTFGIATILTVRLKRVNLYRGCSVVKRECDLMSRSATWYSVHD